MRSKLQDWGLNFPFSEICFHDLDSAQIDAIDAWEAGNWCLILPNYGYLREWTFTVVPRRKDKASGSYFVICY